MYSSYDQNCQYIDSPWIQAIESCGWSPNALLNRLPAADILFSAYKKGQHTDLKQTRSAAMSSNTCNGNEHKGDLIADKR